MRLRGSYFDGRSAKAREVDLLEKYEQVWIRGDDFERIEALADVKIGEQLGKAPRRIIFADGAQLEIPDHQGFAVWLRAIGCRERRVDMAQRSSVLAMACIFLVLFAGFAAYRWGVPLAASLMAQRIPPAITSQISQSTLNLLDKHLLQPSGLDPQRKKELLQGFEQLKHGGAARLQFRSAPKLGPNALALPDGTVLLLDQLVDLAEDDVEVLGVLAHELAHVEQRHGLRQMIEAAALGAFSAWWLGDFSPLIASAPLVLLQARNSRQQEMEADAIAASRLMAAGMDPARLADMLEKIERSQRKRFSANSSSKAGENSEDQQWQEYLSSHPATSARLKALRAFSPGPRIETKN